MGNPVGRNQTPAFAQTRKHQQRLRADSHTDLRHTFVASSTEHRSKRTGVKVTSREDARALGSKVTSRAPGSFYVSPYGAIFSPFKGLVMPNPIQHCVCRAGSILGPRYQPRNQ